MKIPGLEVEEATYVDTPNGIFTAAGIWFQATEEAIEAYAGSVLEHASLSRLLGYAEVWVRSPQTIALWVLPLLMLGLSPLLSALLTLALYVGWSSFGPSFVSLAAVKGLQILDKVLLQALYYVFMLSMMAAQEQYVAVWVGLGGFILLRWGLVKRVVHPLVKRVRTALYALPVPDQILRSLIMRVAMKHRLSLPQLDQLEGDILENWTRKK